MYSCVFSQIKNIFVGPVHFVDHLAVVLLNVQLDLLCRDEFVWQLWIICLLLPWILKKVVDRISITLSSLSVKIEVPTLSDQICNKTITTAAHIIIFIVITLHSDRCETLLRRWWRSTRLTSRTKLFLLSSQIPHLSRVLHSPLSSGVLTWPCFDHLPVVGEVSEISNLENLQTEAFLDLS